MFRLALALFFSAISATAVAQFGDLVEKKTLEGFFYKEATITTEVPFNSCILGCTTKQVALRGFL